jgi:VCBS repeat-containing protein
LRQTIRDYIQWHEQKLGVFTISDPKQIGKLRTLKLVRVHERVGKTGDYYYSCTDMQDVATGDQLDLDFDVSDTAGKLQVVAVRIHKDNGKPRYTYDEHDNLIPLS